MKTQFDKIYVISLITNKDRQEFIKYQMNELNLDFEFIYGVDFYNLKYDISGNEINYPNLIFDYTNLNNNTMFGCTISHYKAILQAYYLNYNNVLIIEDDMCFNKDKTLIENYLNNIPDDADFITYTARFIEYNEIFRFNDDISIQKNKYFKLNNDYMTLCGTGMYALMNRNSMKLYLDNQRKSLYTADHIQCFFRNPSVNRYTTLDTIITDQFNLLNKHNENNIGDYGLQCYVQLNNVNDYNNFYKPNKIKLSNINYNIELVCKKNKLI